MHKRLFVGLMIITGASIICDSHACPPPPNQPPTAKLVVRPKYALPGQTVTLDGSGSYDSDGTITKYEWDFDYNGVSFHCDYEEHSNHASDGAFDGITKHQYTEPNIYVVMLRVTDNQGQTDTDTNTVTVPLAQTYYVDPNGSEDNNGLSWSKAFKTIQYGIGKAGDCNIVEVNRGTYRENINFNSITCILTSVDPNNWYDINSTVI